MGIFLKIFFHKHLKSVTVPTLWRWAKGIAITGAVLWVVPDCIPFIGEITVTWLGISVLWELNSRGEIDAKWLPEGVRKRLGKGHEGAIDVKTDLSSGASAKGDETK